MTTGTVLLSHFMVTTCWCITTKQTVLLTSLVDMEVSKRQCGALGPKRKEDSKAVLLTAQF